MAKRKKDLKSRLEALQSSWEESEPTRAGAAVPDDNYVCRIESAILEEAKSSGRMQVHYDSVILEGDFTDRHVHKYDGLDTPENLPYVQGTLEALELEIPENLGDIGEVLEEAAGLVVAVTVNTRDEFTNIYFNELVEGYEAGEEEKATEEGEDEDYTEEEIKKMKRPELLELIDDEDLDIDPDEYKKLSALKDVVIEEYFE